MPCRARGPALHNGFRPVHKEPVRNASEAPVGIQEGLEPRQDGPVGREQACEVGLIAAITPVVMAGTDPPQRERRDELMQRRGIAAHGDPVGRERAPALLERLTHHLIVAGIVERNHGLDPGIAEILELFVIGAVHVGLIRTQACRTPPRTEDPSGLLPLRSLESRFADEGIHRRAGLKAFDDERLPTGSHPQQDIAPGPPPKRRIAPSGTSVGHNPVGIPDKSLPATESRWPLAPVSALSKSDSAYPISISAPLSATEPERGITRMQHPVIKQQLPPASAPPRRSGR